MVEVEENEEKKSNGGSFYIVDLGKFGWENATLSVRPTMFGDKL